MFVFAILATDKYTVGCCYPTTMTLVSCDGCDLVSSLCKYDLRKGDLLVLNWARVRRGSISVDLLICGGGVRSIVLLPIVARHYRCMYMAHDCFYICCSDCVGVCGNVCCVAAVFKDSVLLVMEC